MNYYSLLPLASFALNLLLIGYVAAVGRHNRAGRAFILYATSIALWGLSEFFIWSPIPHTVVFVLLRATSVFFLSSAFLFLNFVYAIAGRKRNVLYYASAAIALACVIISASSGAYYGPQVVHRYYGHAGARGPFSTLIDACALLPALYALHLIIRLFITSPAGTFRRQLRLLLWGFGLTFTATLALEVVIPGLFGVQMMSPATSSLGVIFIVFIFVAIARHRFLADSVEAIARHLFARMRESVVVLDRGRRVVAANESARRLLGIATGREYLAEDLFPPPYRFDEDCNDLAVTTIAGGKRRHMVLTQMTLMEADEPAGRLVIISDITSQKETATALRESQEKFSSAFNASPIPLSINHVGSGRYLDVNDTMARISGYSREECIGKTPAGLNVFADRAELLAFVRILSEHRRVSGFECRLRHHDGTVYECALSAEPFSIAGEEYVITAMVDVTEQKKSARMIREQYEEIQAQYNVLEVMNEELARTHRDVIEMNRVLAREKERLAATLRAIGEGVITVDADGCIELINPIGERITRYGAVAAEGRPVGEVLPIRNELTGMTCREMVERVLSCGEIVEMRAHTTMTTEDGVKWHISAIGAPIRDPEGTPDGAIVVFRDITERIRMEEELVHASKIETLAVFAGGIAHDFNNLLTSITGNISLARLTTTEDNPFRAVLTEIENAAKRARDLTLQLLTFSKGGAPIRQTISIPALLHDTAEFVLSGSPVRCAFDIPGDLRCAEIDEGQISQVVQNLILNACQAMPEGGTISIAARNVALEDGGSVPLPPGNYVHITVSDHGTGIDETHMGRIFDPFFTTKERGKGLGLAVTYSIIKKHDGHIAVRSRVGEGTTFDIYLPATDGKPAVTAREAAPERFAAGTVLLMDDEELVLATGGRMLRHMGFAVETAHSGEEAIRMYRRAMKEDRPYDIVIMDLTIPGGMGGKDAIDILANIDPGITAIVSSGYSNDPVMANYREYGFSGVVTKPYRYEELAGALLSVRGGAPPSPGAPGKG